MKRSAAMLVTLGMSAAAVADPTQGKQIFDRYCSECHAPGFGHPGTQRLELVRGKVFSVLETRRDLVPLYVRTVVRNGFLEMPAYRPTEIDDSALAALVQYLAPAKPDAKTR
jgi:mono/diheme cytochrome c family protein